MIILDLSKIIIKSYISLRNIFILYFPGNIKE